MTTVALGRSTAVSPLSVMRLHFAQRSTLVTPLLIMVIVFIVTGIIALVFWRTGAVPGTQSWADGSRANPAILWSLPGFFGWLGVQTVSLTFPLALSLGSTRRTFVLGTVLTHVLLSAYVAAVLLVILGVELLTDHWFIGLYVADVFILGGGNPVQLFVTVFLGILLTLSVGGALAASWTRFGAVGPTALSVGTILTLGLIVVLLVPVFSTGFETWWLALSAVVMIGLSILAQYLCLLRSSVR